MKLTLGFSPCPNDTFIFDALVNNKIDTEGLEFELHLEDVQQLNNAAIQNKLDITKISYGVLPLVLKNYIVLSSGSALGKGVGPLLIGKNFNLNKDPHLQNATIAIPGQNTTAHLLFSWAFPQATNKNFMIFSDIEEAVLTGKTDLGVIIHENRFTYQDKGLQKITDLGNEWEDKIKQPIPLGGIVAKRSLPKDILQKIERLIMQSVTYAFKHSLESLPHFIQCHAQEMEEDVMRKHIDLYVNQYSIDLGMEGRVAIETLLKTYSTINPAGISEKDIFL